MRNGSDKNRAENQNKHFMPNNFYSEKRAACEIL
jgi:hypothetical protein